MFDVNRKRNYDLVFRGKPTGKIFKRKYAKDSKWHKKFQAYAWKNGLYTQWKKNGGNAREYTVENKEYYELFGMY